MIKEIIYEYWESKLPEVRHRDMEIGKTDLIIDIVGVRRCGKTYQMFAIIQNLIKKISKRSTIYINFENRKLMPLQQGYFNEIIEFIHAEKLLESGMVYLFLDEVQRINGWEKFVRSIYDEFKGKIKIFVSGSNSNLLSKEYGNLLTGRHLTKTLFPLSFKEFLDFKGYGRPKVILENDRAMLKKYLEEYLTYGGFPEAVLSENKEQILSQLFTDIIARDIITRTVRKEDVVEELASYLAANSSSLFSFTKIANYLKSRGIKISVFTLQNYFWLIKNSFLFFDTLIFSYKLKNQMQNPRKVYCIDTGISNVAGFKFSREYGKLYENAVFLQLKQSFADNPLVKIYYWKNIRQEEVDFVIKRGLKVEQLIQVCFNINNPDVKKREIKALLKASEELRCSRLFVITEDFESKEDIGKCTIMYIPLWKWLLSD